VIFGKNSAEWLFMKENASNQPLVRGSSQGRDNPSFQSTEFKSARSDFLDENVIPLTSAPSYLPRRNGKPIHNSTLFRWASKGVRGVRLETIRVGGSRCTSIEALRRFVAQLSVGQSGKCDVPTKSWRSQERDAQTERTLKRHGVDTDQ
jgi:uncharacterized protein DUF1580